MKEQIGMDEKFTYNWRSEHRKDGRRRYTRYYYHVATRVPISVYLVTPDHGYIVEAIKDLWPPVTVGLDVASFSGYIDSHDPGLAVQAIRIIEDQTPA